MSRKEKLKIYHGLPKSITDQHTVFYASYDGSISPNIGSYYIPLDTAKFCPSINGVGIITGISGKNKPIIKVEANDITIDLFYENRPADGNRIGLISVSDINCQTFVSLYNTGNLGNLSFSTYSSENRHVIEPGKTALTTGINHIRCIVTKTKAKLYINGVFTIERNFNRFENGECPTNKYVGLCSNWDTHVINGTKLESLEAMPYTCPHVISDFHISSIDRGDLFPNLPQDFIDGKAKIKSKMAQQLIKGDPMITHPVTVVVPAYVGDNMWLYTLDPSDGTGTVIKHPEITKVNGASTWGNNVSSFVVKGLNSEIISGVDGSQSPIVRTQDGTIVLGSWTGLGTSELKFTLGTNPISLTGKDLYVTYTLNIPSGNSDLSELPYSIDTVYDVNGNKLPKVDSITIKDSFIGKILNDTAICPHTVKYESVVVGNLNKDSFTKELSQGAYNLIKYNDSSTIAVTSSATKNAQKMFSFNIIDIIERKFNSKIPGDTLSAKIAWLDKYVSNVTLKWTGRATLVDSSDRASLSFYAHAKGEWKVIQPSFNSSGWDSGVSTSSITVMPTTINQNVKTMSDIASDGSIHILASTVSTTNGSKLETDFIEILITFKGEDNFDLYCLNDYPMARNGEHLNPILIQKQTKTIKKYLPNPDCFVTELSYVDPKAKEIDIIGKELLSNEPFIYAITLGTGSLNSEVGVYNECLAKLGMPLSKESYKFTNEILRGADTFLSNNTRVKTLVGQMSNGGNYATLPNETVNAQNYALLKPYLLNIDGQLVLSVYARQVSNNIQTSCYGYKYAIPNSPLIK